MRQTTGVGGGELAQREVTGADVGVQLILAAAALLEGTEQSAVGLAEWRGLKVAGHDGGVDMAVVRRIADREHEKRQVMLNCFTVRQSRRASQFGHVAGESVQSSRPFVCQPPRIRSRKFNQMKRFASA
jgi:hypothetical protein